MGVILFVTCLESMIWDFLNEPAMLSVTHRQAENLVTDSKLHRLR